MSVLWEEAKVPRSAKNYKSLFRKRGALCKIKIKNKQLSEVHINEILDSDCGNISCAEPGIFIYLQPKTPKLGKLCEIQIKTVCND